MRTEVISARTIDEAAAEVLEVLKEKANTTRSASTRDNVFYFDGWDGLGASSVLRAIAQHLTPTSPVGRRILAELGFDQVIHIDCSMWVSRRALQRAVAEQLALPGEVMEMFNRQDEEDDFRGLARGSRDEIQQVVRETHRRIQKMDRRFLVIFHNGSGEEIDLASLFGFPLSGYSTNKVLWTFQGRFRLKPRVKVDMAMKSAATTDTFLSATSWLYQKVDVELWSYLVHQEAAEVAAACKITTRPSRVVQCFIYMLELCCIGRHSIEYALSTHAANYWVCDGIMQQLQQGERDLAEHDNDWLWRSADALRFEMQLDEDYYQYFPSSHLSMCIERQPYWISPNYGFNRIPDRAIPNGDMFQHYSNKLRVLKLSRCTFNFQSPPFLCCHNLRFLWLHHCQHTGTSTDGAGKEEDIRRCFQRLWVLDLRYTHCDQILSARKLDIMTQLRELNVMGARDWDMGQLQGRLPNIRKLRVTKSRVSCGSDSKNNLFSEMNKMELLDFTGNRINSPTMSLSSPGAISNRAISPTSSLCGQGVSSNSSCLETVIVGDCDGHGLEQISFRGCTKLKNLLLEGSTGKVDILDISGTAVKTLDLTRVEYTMGPRELRLLDCEKLCAILWPPEDKMELALDKLYIDTTQPVPTSQSREEKFKRVTVATTEKSVAATVLMHGSRPTNEFCWYISVRDARFLVFLEPVYSNSREAYVEVSSPTRHVVAANGSKDEGIKSGSSNEQQVMINLQQKPAPTIYADITHLQQATEGDDDDDALGIVSLWPCPDVPDLLEKNCYMHIQDQVRTKSQRGGEETSTIVVPDFVIECARILHVHDSLSITSTRSASMLEWHALEWCRIERCPKLVYVFTYGIRSYYRAHNASYKLRTLWVSQVPKANYIFEPSPEYSWRTFLDLTFLHVDRCARLIHVIPLSLPVITGNVPSFKQLETLEILWCGELREVFALDTDARGYLEQVPDAQPVTLDFPSLKRIHLHELPSLQHICDCGVRMSAPNLETVKIRGCWSLTRLPDVGDGDKAVECDCEKEWWDRLEWDYGSQATRYKPIHSQYYKKKMLRSTVLR